MYKNLRQSLNTNVSDVKIIIATVAAICQRGVEIEELKFRIGMLDVLGCHRRINSKVLGVNTSNSTAEEGSTEYRYSCPQKITVGK